MSPNNLDLQKAYSLMLKIRLSEEWLLEKMSNKQLSGTCHTCIGQEAVAVGVGLAINENDVFFSNHRGHGHMIAKGMSLKSILGEIAGKDFGICKGLGGSQHIAQTTIGFMGSNGITGGGVPVATGYALALKLKKSSNKVIIFFGDGAFNQGVVAESLNIASIWQLPIIFVCENNHYAMSASDTQFVAGSITERAKSFNIKSRKVNGMLVDNVYDATLEALKHNGPFFLEMDTYRFCGHSKSDIQVYRTKEEVTSYKQYDPVMQIEKLLDLDFINQTKEQINLEIKEIENLLYG